MRSRETTSDPWWAWALAIAGVSAAQAAMWWAGYRSSAGPPPRENLAKRRTPPPEPVPELDRGKVQTQLGEGAGFTIRNRDRAWATETTAREFRAALKRYAARGGATVRVGDVSKRGGGKLAPHLSHQLGQDLDVRLPAKDEDLAMLLQELADTGWLDTVFLNSSVQKRLYDLGDDDATRDLLQYPEKPHTGTAYVRHWPGHGKHIHVRFFK